MTANLDNLNSVSRLPAKRPVRKTDPNDIVVFLIPFMQVLQLHIVGSVSGSDILLILVFGYLVIRGGIKLKAPQAKRLMVLCSLWLLSQIVTDIVRHTAFADYSRGWSNIGLTLVNFAVFFSLLYQKPKRLAIYGWGLVIGGLLHFWLTPDKYMEEDPWKFGISGPVCWAIFLIASRKGHRGRWPLVVATGIGVLDIAMGSRSTGGFCLAAVLYISVTRLLQRKTKGTFKLKSRSVAAIAASLLLGAIGITGIYSYAARTGMLGGDARDKYEQEAAGKYGLLIGGRIESLASLPAIYASPILGHGSWARDPLYVFLERRGMALLGYKGATEFDLEDMKQGYIPTHSFILGAWVYAGILGALFWSWVLFQTANALLRVYPITVPLLPLAAFAGFRTMWDCLFSPYGAEMRIITPFYIVLLMTCVSFAPRSSRRETDGAKKIAKRVPVVAQASAS